MTAPTIPHDLQDLNRLFLEDCCRRWRADELILFDGDPNNRTAHYLAAARHEALRLLANKKRSSRSTWLPQHVAQRELFKRRRGVTL